MKTMSRITVSVLILLMLLVCAVSAAADSVPGVLNQRVSSRSGPGTIYDETGTFFSGNYEGRVVDVVTKAWDNRNGIWWVQIEFVSGGNYYRLYTGKKRVDMDLNDVPEETVLGSGVMLQSSVAYWGPGTYYAASHYNVPAGLDVTVIAVENGYCQVEFYDERIARSSIQRRRAWVPTSYVSGNWSGWDVPESSTAVNVQNGIYFKYYESNGSWIIDTQDYIFVSDDGRGMEFTLRYAGIGAFRSSSCQQNSDGSYRFEAVSGSNRIGGTMWIDYPWGGSDCLITIEINSVNNSAVRTAIDSVGGLYAYFLYQ